jgi:hypothetical protein
MASSSSNLVDDHQQRLLELIETSNLKSQRIIATIDQLLGQTSSQDLWMKVFSNNHIDMEQRLILVSQILLYDDFNLTTIWLVLGAGLYIMYKKCIWPDKNQFICFDTKRRNVYLSEEAPSEVESIRLTDLRIHNIIKPQCIVYPEPELGLLDGKRGLWLVINACPLPGIVVVKKTTQIFNTTTHIAVGFLPNLDEVKTKYRVTLSRLSPEQQSLCYRCSHIEAVDNNYLLRNDPQVQCMQFHAKVYRTHPDQYLITAPPILVGMIFQKLDSDDPSHPRGKLLGFSPSLGQNDQLEPLTPSQIQTLRDSEMDKIFIF